MYPSLIGTGRSAIVFLSNILSLVGLTLPPFGSYIISAKTLNSSDSAVSYSYIFPFTSYSSDTNATLWIPLLIPMSFALNLISNSRASVAVIISVVASPNKSPSIESKYA